MKHSFIENLISRYPALAVCQNDITRAAEGLCHAFKLDKQLFVAGNGGSGCDAEHIAGELLKGFMQRRPLSPDLQEQLAAAGQEGIALAASLQRGLRCFSLLSHPGFASAFANDVDSLYTYAQQLSVLGRPGDWFWGISTGGNAANLKYCYITARALNIKTILLTGNRHGELEQFADCVIAVPETETYKIQELHLPVYHAVCQMVEAELFGKESSI